MTPDFALTLSSEGISLLRRDAGGWRRIGDAPLDGRLDAAMAALVETARAAAPDGTAVRVIVPNEQIKYLDLPGATGGPDDADSAARTALEGATPYEVSELRFDTAEAGDRLFVAAVAQETLDEAETFARQHGFRPVAFAAVPPAGTFRGEAFFGAASSWDGPAPDREAHAIRERSGAPASGTAAAPVPNADPAQSSVRRGSAPETTPTPTPASARTAAATQPSAAPTKSGPQAEHGMAHTRPSAPDPRPERSAPPATSNEARQRPAAAARGTEPAQSRDGEDGAPAAVRATPSSSTAPSSQAARQPAAPSGAGSQSAETVPTFSSIRAARGADTAGSAAPQVRAEPRPDAQEPRRAQASVAPIPSEAAQAPIRSFDPPAPLPTDDRPGTAAPAPSARAAGVPPAPTAAERARALARFGRPRAADATAGPRDDAAPPSGTRIAALRPGREPDGLNAPRPAQEGATKRRGAGAATLGADDERQRMTVFGERAREAEIGGKPRFLGLVLTSALLLVLAGVAAWASVFLDEGLSRFFGSEPDTRVTESAPASEPTGPEASDTGSDDTRLAALETARDTDSAADAPRALAQPAPSVLSSEEAEDSYAATGIWQRTPTAPLPLEPGMTADPHAVASDPEVAVGELGTLEGPETGPDSAYAAPMPPAPAGTVFDLDERGMVIATAEGAINPDRVRIFAGRPPAVPPNRSSVIPQGTSASDAAGVEALQQLGSLSPRRRPAPVPETAPPPTIEAPATAEADAADTADTAEAETDAATDPGPTDNAVPPVLEAALAPTPVPSDAGDVAAAVAAQAAETAESAALPDFSDATARAIDLSPKPSARPSGFSETVQSSQAAPRRVATATVAPSSPSGSSVTQRATVRNVLDLRRINLIGVYGQPSSRRALVRLPNGRYEKVKVGDRIDGGRIAAIGEAELRYVKGGRSQTLRMP